MSAWEKLQLGWLDYKVVPFGQDSTVKVGPAGQDVKTNSQAVVVTLPDKTTTAYNTPHSGKAEWWSGSSDNRTATLARSVDLTGATTSAALTAWVQADIEKDFDYLYAEVSTNAGATWTQIGAPLTGTSAWTQRSYDLSAYKGQNVQFRFRYATDGGLSLKGAFIDDVAVTKDGVAGAVDDVEAGAGAWTASGFSIISGTETKVTPRYYIAENRTYTGYDDTLRTGPYNFGWTSTRPDWVERFPYQNGLLVSYVDYAYNDNNTITHPGAGLVLPVDARPTPIKFPSGALLGNRRQPFDATFGQEATDAVTFHLNGVPVTVPSSAGIPTFDDTDPNRYWSSGNPRGSVKVAGTGTSMTVTNTRDGGNELQVHVAFAG
jgi:immune inhibitor A